jgi:nitroreductase
MNEPRRTEFPIEPFFIERWSPRSFVPADMPDADLMSLFEAAKWAPSSFNNQPWRFLYAKRGSSFWKLFLDLLVPVNQAWAGDASVLVVILANKNFDHNGKPSPTHSFDAGAAFENLALQACCKGYAAHGMQGFDYDKARTVLEVPPEFAVEAMIAIGKPDPKEKLPAELQQREFPNSRRPLRESIAEGKFAPSLLHAEKKG